MRELGKYAPRVLVRQLAEHTGSRNVAPRVLVCQLAEHTGSRNVAPRVLVFHETRDERNVRVF